MPISNQTRSFSTDYEENLFNFSQFHEILGILFPSDTKFQIISNVDGLGVQGLPNNACCIPSCSSSLLFLTQLVRPHNAAYARKIIQLRAPLLTTRAGTSAELWPRDPRGTEQCGIATLCYGPPPKFGARAVIHAML